jgi:hypothetical protein
VNVRLSNGMLSFGIDTTSFTGRPPVEVQLAFTGDDVAAIHQAIKQRGSLR